MTQQNLFGPSSDYADTFSEAVTRLGLLVTPLIWKAHKDSIADLGDRMTSDRRFSRLRSGERANWLHRQIIEDARELLKEFGVETAHRWHEVHAMDILYIENIGTIGFKRLRRGLRRSNYDTQHNGQYWSQSITEREVKLIVGYRPNEKWTDASIYLTLPSGPARGPVLEYVQIPDQTEQLIHITRRVPAAELPAAKEPPRFVIKPKRDTRKKQADSDAG
jgi:hypothetical protein